MASDMIARVDQGIPLNWKKAIVPKSPIEQPSRHHRVFFEEVRQSSSIPW
jgi:hypothetical protein